jgi:hypothetical protein
MTAMSDGSSTSYLATTSTDDDTSPVLEEGSNPFGLDSFFLVLVFGHWRGKLQSSE